MTNNEENDKSIEMLAAAWHVKTADITNRVASAMGLSDSHPSITDELLAEIRLLRKEMDAVRESSALLQEEVLRLRIELTSRKVTRVAPYSAAEGIGRLS